MNKDACELYTNLVFMVSAKLKQHNSFNYADPVTLSTVYVSVQSLS